MEAVLAGKKGRSGRPTKYTKKIAEEICNRLAEGETLNSVCRDDQMPSPSAVRGWVLDDQQGFSVHYARARELGYQAMADDLVEITDDARNDWMARPGNNTPGYELNGEHVQRSRLRVDTRKWLLSKALPKVYGDKVDVNHSGEMNVNIGKDDGEL